MAGKFTVEGVFKLTDRMTRPISKMETRLDTMMRRVGERSSAMAARITKGFSAFEAGMKSFGKHAREPLQAIGSDFKTIGTAVVGATVAAGTGLVQVMRTGMDFEKTLLSAGNKFEPGIKKTSETFKTLSKAAQEVGGNTEFSSSQAALALKELAGAGFNAEQAVGALPGVVDLATASELDLSGATEVAAKSLGAFAMKDKDPKILAKNLQRVSDVLMKTDDISSTNIPAIFEAMKEGGPVAQAAGASLETFMTMVAQLGEAGIEGSSAGTTLKNMFLSLSAPSTEAAASLANLGIKTKDAKGNLRDMFDLLGDLQQKTAKMGTADKADVIESIFGKIPIAGVNNLLGKVEALRENREKLEKSGGQVQLVAESKRAGGTASWDNLTSGLEALSLAIFEVVGGPMNSLIDGTTEWISTFKKDAIPFVKEFVAGFKDGFSQAWPVLKKVLDLLFTGFGGNTEWQARVRDFATLLGKVVAGAAALATVLGGMLAAAMQMATGLINTLIGAWNGLVAAIGYVSFAISDFFANLQAKFSANPLGTLGEIIARGFLGGLYNGIKGGIGYIGEAIQALGDSMISKFRSVLDMRSPSRRTRKEVGAPAAAGIGVGWTDEMDNVNAKIEKSIEASPMVQPLAPPTIPSINSMSLGTDAYSAPEVQPELMSQEERIALAGGGDLGKGEIVIRDETGRAEVTEQPKRTKIKLEPARS